MFTYGISFVTKACIVCWVLNVEYVHTGTLVTWGETAGREFFFHCGAIVKVTLLETFFAH